MTAAGSQGPGTVLRGELRSCGGLQWSVACWSWSGDVELIQSWLLTSGAHANQLVQIKLSDKSYNAACP